MAPGAWIVVFQNFHWPTSSICHICFHMAVSTSSVLVAEASSRSVTREAITDKSEVQFGPLESCGHSRKGSAGRRAILHESSSQVRLLHQEVPRGQGRDSSTLIATEHAGEAQVPSGCEGCTSWAQDATISKWAKLGEPP